MANIYSGGKKGEGLKIGVVVSRFNEFLSRQLLAGALDELEKMGVDKDNIDVAWVPGAFELPLIAQNMAQGGLYQAIVCLGVVIRGATPHFDYICSQAARGIAGVSQNTGLPATFGVVTADTLEQAIERCGGKSGNKGREAAAAAIELADLLNKLK